MRKLFGVTPSAPYTGEKPVKDEKYCRFIRSFGCQVCNLSPVDPCHTGPHALSQKASDSTCIPLCRKHHEECDQDPRGFERRHELSIEALTTQYREMYRMKREAAA